MQRRSRPRARRLLHELSGISRYAFAYPWLLDLGPRAHESMRRVMYQPAGSLRHSQRGTRWRRPLRCGRRGTVPSSTALPLELILEISSSLPAGHAHQRSTYPGAESISLCLARKQPLRAASKTFLMIMTSCPVDHPGALIKVSRVPPALSLPSEPCQTALRQEGGDA